MIYYGDSFYGRNIYENMFSKAFEDDYNIYRLLINTGKDKIRIIVKIPLTPFSIGLIQRKSKNSIISDIICAKNSNCS